MRESKFATILCLISVSSLGFMIGIMLGQNLDRRLNTAESSEDQELRIIKEELDDITFRGMTGYLPATQKLIERQSRIYDKKSNNEGSWSDIHQFVNWYFKDTINGCKCDNCKAIENMIRKKG